DCLAYPRELLLARVRGGGHVRAAQPHRARGRRVRRVLLLRGLARALRRVGTPLRRVLLRLAAVRHTRLDAREPTLNLREALAQFVQLAAPARRAFVRRGVGEAARHALGKLPNSVLLAAA